MEFTNYYDRNELYFPSKTADKISDVRRKLWEIWEDWLKKKDYEISSKDVDLQIEHWRKTWEKVGSDIPKVKDAIKTEFREIIGVE